MNWLDAILCSTYLFLYDNIVKIILILFILLSIGSYWTMIHKIESLEHQIEVLENGR
jgi:hypothetical protein